MVNRLFADQVRKNDRVRLAGGWVPVTRVEKGHSHVHIFVAEGKYGTFHVNGKLEVVTRDVVVKNGRRTFTGKYSA